MRYKAIFFDRDGVLTTFNSEKIAWRDQTIAAWSGRSFHLSYDTMMELFALAAEGRKQWYQNVEDERAFFKRFYRVLLMHEGVAEDLDMRATRLFEELWCNHDRLLCPETVEVLEYFHHKGYRMGVISDTSPSLEYTLQQLGIASYFTSFTASSLVGAGKPSPVIFNAALRAQGVSAGESLYVDDNQTEADGARAQGFTSFWLNRSGSDTGEWTITSLKQLLSFVEREEKREDPTNGYCLP
ncbi:MAG: HAD family hydrolase [Clostridia bacterium]